MMIHRSLNEVNVIPEETYSNTRMLTNHLDGENITPNGLEMCL